MIPIDDNGRSGGHDDDDDDDDDVAVKCQTTVILIDILID
jgi:hypothetical protein